MIVGFATLIKNDKYYKINYIQSCIGLNEDFSLFENYLMDSLVSSYSPLNSFTKFWCEIDKFEIKVLVTYFIFLSIYLLFEVLSFLIHKQKINIFNVKKGIFYILFISINIFFYILFITFFPLLLDLFLYSVIVTASSPYQDENLNDDNDIADK